ncbi:carbonic anhydrase 12 isoform 2-T4 [Spinachia spinachia]
MHFRSVTPIVFLLMTLLALLHGAKWTYSGPEGQHYWPKRYPYCGGAFQSPLDLKPGLLRFDPTLRPIEIQNYNLSPDEQLTLGNNGHCVQISLPSKMHISSLPHRYTAAQLHLHWGSAGRVEGSEHMVNSKQYAAEVGEFNPAFEKFFRFLNGVKYKDQKVQVPGFNIRELLPVRLDDYYRYDGSLTTPPCYPSVLWTVFRNHVTISRAQFLALATSLYSSNVQDSAPVPLNVNYRRTQPPDNRVVLTSFKEGNGPQGTLTGPSPLRRKQIVQQLMAGDLADLADEGLHQLLPSGSEKGPSKKKVFRDQESETPAKSKEQTLNSALWRKSQTDGLVGKLGLAEDTLCFVSLEQRVARQQKLIHAEDQLVQALRDAAFPELNLKSYLGCKSDLALPTITHILHGRPTDEANELEHSLKKAFGKKKTSTAVKQTVPGTKSGGFHTAAVARKPHSQAHLHPWLLPMEWED